jgi:hypothetical protein
MEGQIVRSVYLDLVDLVEGSDEKKHVRVHRSLSMLVFAHQ